MRQTIPRVNRYTQIPYELYQRLQVVADKVGLSVNAAIVAAIEEWVKTRESEAKEVAKGDEHPA
ncbi:MAG TPA: hypothetical protein GXX55_07150 [Firmicutes bacterium]|nr:hypothetical protein [Bacillota bacterium]